MQTSKVKPLALSLVAFVSLCLPTNAKQALAAPEPSKYPAIVLEQSNDIYGKTKTTISNAGIKIQVLNSNAVLIAQAPAWQVMFYNTLSKKCLSLSEEKWLHHNQFTTYSGRDWDRTNLALHHPSTVTKFERKMRLNHVAGSLSKNGVVRNPKVENADYVDLENLPVAPEAIAIMQKTLSTPYSSGVPVEFINHLPEAKKTEAFRSNSTGDQTYLKTLKISEEMVSPRAFDYPSNFITETSEAGVINDAQRKKQVDAAIDTFLH